MVCVQRSVNPDSWWSCVVCLSATVSVLTVTGFAMSFGVFHPYLMVYFGENKERTSWLGSIVLGLMLFSGPFAVFLTDRFGHRTVNMTCGFICSASVMASSFVNHLMLLYFSFSVLFGFCGGIMLNIALTEVKIHFKKYFPLASGMIISGSSAGMMILSQVNELLIEALDWRHSFQIISGLVFLATITSITYDSRVTSQRQEVVLDPKTAKLHLSDQNDVDTTLLEEQIEIKEKLITLENTTIPVPESEKNDIDTLDEINQEKALLHKSNHVATNSKNTYVSEQNDCVDNTFIQTTGAQQIHRKMTLKDVLSLFRNVYFVFGIGANAIVCIGFFTPQIHLMQYSLDLGMTHRKSAQLYIYYAIANIISRLVSGHLASKVNLLSPLALLQLAEFFCGLSVILLSLAKSYSHLVGFCVAYGITNGAVVSINVLFAISVVEPVQSGLALGVNFMVSSIPVICGPPFAGYIADSTGSYVMSFYVAGGIMTFASLLPCIIHIKKLLSK